MNRGPNHQWDASATIREIPWEDAADGMRLREHEDGALRYVTVEPDDYPDGASYPLVVMLHGYGAHMGDLASIAPAIDPDGYVYAFPNAPHPLETGLGPVGFAWAFFPPAEDDDDASESESLLTDFIDDVEDRLQVPEGQIVLGGFSQGGMMTLNVGLRSPDRFRGLAVLSGRLMDDDTLDDLPERPTQSIFLAHGADDEIIAVEEGRRVRDSLRRQGYSPEYHEYAMAHEIAPDEIADLTRWLHAVLPPGGSL